MLSAVPEAITACVCMCVHVHLFLRLCAEVFCSWWLSGCLAWCRGPRSVEWQWERWSLIPGVSGFLCSDRSTGEQKTIQQCAGEWQACSLRGSLTAGNVLKERGLLSPNGKPHHWSFDSVGHWKKKSNVVNNVWLYATHSHSQGRQKYCHLCKITALHHADTNLIILI